jgi:DNA-directed RNA polymerase subunit M/transcription elongation factor TFIIS
VAAEGALSLFVVVNCPHCGELMIADASKNTRSCPKCGYRAEIRALRVVGRAETAAEARGLLQRLKMRRAGEEDLTPTFRHLDV